uniref:G_PROTEIN_RECEP_F1_2 domain-containing protein n=1 Tax=Panagrellus redivivus TaxID=6233 RepID=A0A7E4W1V3_PANRE
MSSAVDFVAVDKPFTDRERIGIGLVYLITALFTLILHSMVVIMFMFHKDLRCQNVYRIMLIIGICECLQEVSHVYSGIVVLTQTKYSLFLDGFLGGLANSAWIAMIALSLVLAVERLFIFRKLSPSRNYSGIYFFFCIICLIYGSTFFAVYLTTYTGIEFDILHCYWSYNDGPWSDIVSLTEYYTTVPLLILTFLVYIAIFVIIIAMKKNTSANRNKAEYRLLITSFFNFIYATALICCWHYYALFLPDSPWTSIVINVGWIAFGALNPVMYLTMNR